MKIIVINGSARSGKDSFVNFAKNSDAEVYNFSMIDYVKAQAKKIGWRGAKDAEGRRFLSDLKDAFDIYNDVPFQYVKRQIKFVCEDSWNTDNLVIYVHAREPKDIQRWVDEANAKTLLIRRASAEEAEASNHADRNVFDYDYDYVYRNEGDLAQLEREAINFTNWIKDKPWNSKI